MSRDRKGSPSVSPSESSEAWLESHASEPGGLREDALPDAGPPLRDAGKLFPRRVVPEGSARREARPDRKGVHAHVLRKPGLLR